jgi:hypothetical protein
MMTGESYQRMGVDFNWLKIHYGTFYERHLFIGSLSWNTNRLTRKKISANLYGSTYHFHHHQHGASPHGIDQTGYR